MKLIQLVSKKCRRLTSQAVEAYLAPFPSKFIEFAFENVSIARNNGKSLYFFPRKMEHKRIFNYFAKSKRKN